MQFLTDPLVVTMASKISLSDNWKTFYKAIKGQAGPILNLMAVVGVVLVVVALIKWAWDRRRGGGGGFGGQQSSAIWGALLVGCLLSAPAVIIPMFLLVMDVIANAGISVWNSST